MNMQKLPFTPDSSWGRCLADFLQRTHERTGSQSTFAHYRAILQDYLASQPKTPDQFTKEDVLAYLRSPGKGAGREGRAVKFGTQNNRLAAIKSFYAFARDYGVPDEKGRPQPLLGHLPPTSSIASIQRERPPYRSLTDDELQAFFAAIDPATVQGLKYRALFLTYFWCARRRHEISSLTWGAIEEATFVEGDGRSRHGYLYHWRGKGKSRIDDAAELPEICYQAIIRYLEADGRRASIQADDPIFTTDSSYHGQGGRDPRRQLSDQAIWSATKRYAARAGLDPKRVTVHSFRHAAASARYRAGQGVHEIKTLLRHASLDMTDVYLRELVSPADSGVQLLTSRYGGL